LRSQQVIGKLVDTLAVAIELIHSNSAQIARALSNPRMMRRNVRHDRNAPLKSATFCGVPDRNIRKGGWRCMAVSGGRIVAMAVALYSLPLAGYTSRAFQFCRIF